MMIVITAKYIGNAIRHTILILVALLAVSFKAHATSVDTFKVYFATGITRLSKTQQVYLDSVVRSIGTNSSLRVIGYADEPGTTQLNQFLGEHRAQAVASYLISLGLRKESIVQCIGRGNLFKTGVDARQRRADIVLASGRSSLPGDTTAHRMLTEGESELDLLPAMKPNEVLVLEGLQFAVSTSEFLPESYPVLRRLVEVLRAHPNIKIKIEGHICCGPDPKWLALAKDYFFSLSVERARHVRDYLVGNQIAAARLSYEGFGFSKPRVYPERSERDRFRNRRVELRIVSN